MINLKEEIVTFIGDHNNFKLEKLNSLEGTSARMHVLPGDTSYGPVSFMELSNDQFRLNVGGMGGILTSTVKALVYKSDTMLTLETRNSLYSLAKV